MVVPRNPCSRFGNAPIKATGVALDMCVKATIIMSSLFIGPALLELATAAAQRDCVAEGNDCQEAKIHRFRPSSLLANMSVVSGLLTCAFLPLFGAIVDHTRHRRLVGILSGILAVGLIGVQISISVERKPIMKGQ